MNSAFGKGKNGKHTTVTGLCKLPHFTGQEMPKFPVLVMEYVIRTAILEFPDGLNI